MVNCLPIAPHVPPSLLAAAAEALSSEQIGICNHKHRVVQVLQAFGQVKYANFLFVISVTSTSSLLIL